MAQQQDIKKDPITTHVLDTTTGRPAQGVEAHLFLIQGASAKASSVFFFGKTNADGRITNWERQDRSSGEDASQTLESCIRKDEQTTWQINYEVERYYGQGKTFFPQVQLIFHAQRAGPDDAGHLHVPLLLGPWSYTTYRGS